MAANSLPDPFSQSRVGRLGVASDDPTWRKIRGHILSRINELRTALETPGREPLDTEFSRGSIAELRVLLNEVDLPIQAAPEDHDPLNMLGGVG